MSEPAAHQPDQAWCLAEETREGVGYICTRNSHRGGAHKLIKAADMPTSLRAALNARSGAVIELDTAKPLDQRANAAAAMVKATADGRTSTDLAYSDLIKIVNTAETLRFEGQTTIELYSLLDSARRVLDQARAQEGERQPVDAAIIRQLPDIARRFTTQIEGWALQRDLNRTEGAGS